MFKRYTKCLCSNLTNFRMQSLAHFSSTMRDKNCTVCIQMNQCSALIHEFGGEINSIFCGKDCKPSLHPLVLLVEFFNRCPTINDISLCHYSVPHGRYIPASACAQSHNHSEMSCVSILIHVVASHFLNGNFPHDRKLFQDVFTHCHSLWSAKASKSSVGWLDRPTRNTNNTHIWPLVAIVDMEKCSVNDRTRQIKCPPSI
mmetsp:Transcript_27867/g.42864  ORF Transcript_27867/g.42864 Transcript_27867/m.42864 type:complete len:201 (-) Transcript_27867:414-1016(-)